MPLSKMWKPIRVEESLKTDKVVILAGFQGVSPITKEITTLGRGGSDTSAVAMAACFHAERCEILKDVPAVFSADPHIVKTARPLHELNYDQLMEMTFGEQRFYTIVPWSSPNFAM